MKLYEMMELKWQLDAPVDSWVAVDLQATFSCEGKSTKVKGFYAGDGIYKVRFLPQKKGHYTWQVGGMIQDSGEFDCEQAIDERGDVPHGLVQADGMHFSYEDGTLFTPIGTTVYALAHQPQALIEETLETLKTAPFNKVRHCIFPKHLVYNDNEPDLFAFEEDDQGHWDVNRPCMAFWDHVESLIERLGKMEIQSDLILFHPYDRWGFSDFSMEENLVYLDYVMRRLAAYPFIWWSMANEYDTVFSRGKEDWYVIEDYIVKNDPYHHLLSNHQCVVIYDFTRKNISHCCLQISDVNRVKEFRQKYKKPVVYDECTYEGNIDFAWGNISGFEMTNRFWCIYTQGAYASHGETFLSEDDILWWAKGGILKGQSPARIAFLKEILGEAKGPLEPWQLDKYAAPEDKDDPLAPILKARKDNPLTHMYLTASQEDKAGLFQCPEYAGCCEKQFFLRYFARTCPGVTILYLPEDANYQIEVIDVWEMTRRQVFMGASGRQKITLPGKEGIAVLAKRI